MDTIEYIRNLINNGRKVGIFSCEDPLNAIFHKDVFNLGTYLHAHFTPGGVIEPYTLDLGLSHKHIDAWGVFCHYGEFNTKKVCGAVNALLKGYGDEGKDFKKYLDTLKIRFPLNKNNLLKENVMSLIKSEYGFLLKNIKEKQKNFGLKKDVIVFAGIVYNLSEMNYKSEILFESIVKWQ